MPEYVKIGRIVATFGVNGELIIAHELGDSFSKIKILFIEQYKGSYIPYFIHSVKERNSSDVTLSFEDIHTKEAARALLKKKVYLEKDLFERVVTPASDLFLIGFQLIDTKGKNIGEVAEILHLPGQKIAKVFKEKQELLIPLTSQTLLEIDEKKKEIFVELPDGLLDIYKT